jgi:hypothetical protein
MFTQRWRRRLGMGVMLLTCAALVGVTGAQAQQAPETKAKITLDLKEVPLRSAIEALFDKTGLQYAVETVTPNTPVTLSLHDVDFTTALRTLTRLAGVTYRKESSIFLVGPRRAQPPAAEPVAENLAVAAPAGPARGEQTWEKIPILFNSAAVLAYALGGQILPTEDQLHRGGYGGYGGGGYGLNGFGGNGGLGGYGGRSGLGGGMSGYGGRNGYGSGLGGYNGLNTGGTGYNGPLPRARF